MKFKSRNEVSDEVSAPIVNRKRGRAATADEVSSVALPAGDSPIYSIGAVERMLGVPAATFRNWEERYGLVTPERSEGGHRLYTRTQVEQLRFVKQQSTRGFSRRRRTGCSASGSSWRRPAFADAEEPADRGS